MNRVRRAFILLAVSLVVTVIAIVLRTLNAEGFFTDFKPTFAGRCAAIAQGFSAGDMQVDAKDHLLFAAAHDGIYAIELSDATRRASKLEGTPPDFHPTGISLYRGNGDQLTLMALSRHANGQSAVDIFAVVRVPDGLELRETGTIAGGELVSPNSIAAVGPDRFYVTNDHTSTTWLGRLFENYLLLPRGNVLYFDGNVFRPVVGRLSLATGVQVAPDGRHLYVASMGARTLYSFERNPFTGALREVGELDLPAALTNIDVEPGGMLFVAGYPKLFEVTGRKSVPTEIFKVATPNGVASEAIALYGNAGDEISAASVAASDGTDLFVGSGTDSKVLDCKLQ